jgi:hypothetical protein
MTPDTPAPSEGEAPSPFVLHGRGPAELHVSCTTTELMLQSREIEDQTRVPYLGRHVQLWEALKSVTETCFSLWSQADRTRREAFIRGALEIKERSAGEGQDLVFLALKNPLQSKAIARVLLLGHNFLRTLDICHEALLRFPSQKSVAAKPTRTDVAIDWAIGGIRDWEVHYPYAFEQPGRNKKTAPQRLAHANRHYSTERSVRSQISHKQIANIFLLRDSTVADLERRGLAKLRASFKSSQEEPGDSAE